MKRCALKDLCTIDYGFAFNSSKFNDAGNGMPLVRIRDIKPGFTKTYTTESYDQKYIVRTGDLLIGMDGEFNVTKWCSGEALMNQRVCRVTSNSESTSNEFLRFFLAHKLKQIEQKTSFVTVKHLSAKTLGSIDVPSYSLAEQEAMAKQLNAVDGAKEALSLLRDKLDDLVKSAFVEMFGGIEPTIPLSSICEVFTDGDWIESKDQSACGIRLIQTGNIGNGTFRNKGDKSRYVSEETFSRLQCKEIIPGDILISRLPDPVGRACVLPSGLGRCITAVDCTILRLKPDWNASFVVWFSRMEEYSNQVVSSLTGTTRKRISRSNLGKIKVPNVEPALQVEFAAFVSKVDKLGFDVRQQIGRLVFEDL